MANQYTWCDECHRHKYKCSCDAKLNIYVVEYRMLVMIGMYDSYCQEKVRCIAYDFQHARSSVINWAMTTTTIWSDEGSCVKEWPVPTGTRQVTILDVEKYAEDVGGLLKQLSLPEIFAHEG